MEEGKGIKLVKRATTWIVQGQPEGLSEACVVALNLYEKGDGDWAV